MAKQEEYPFGFKISRPAERALLHHGYDTVDKLFAATDQELLDLHGVGRLAIELIRAEQAKQSGANGREPSKSGKLEPKP